MDTNQLVPQDPFQAMERMDEQQVLDEIKGRAIEALVYEIRQGNQTVTGLSLAGVREVVRAMNVAGKSRVGIADREPIITETEDYFEVKVFAQDTQNGGGYWGIKRQPKRYPNNNTNPFALEQALAKAQRNALRGLIPEYFAKEMIDAFRAKGKVSAVSGDGNEHTMRGKAWNLRVALVQWGAQHPYYENAHHFLRACEKAEKDGLLKREMNDDEARAVMEQYAQKRADEKAASGPDAVRRG